MWALNQCELDAHLNPNLLEPLVPWKVALNVYVRPWGPGLFWCASLSISGLPQRTVLKGICPAAGVAARALAAVFPSFGEVPSPAWFCLFSYCLHFLKWFSFRFVSSPGKIWLCELFHPSLLPAAYPFTREAHSQLCPWTALPHELHWLTKAQNLDLQPLRNLRMTKMRLCPISVGGPTITWTCLDKR